MFRKCRSNSPEVFLGKGVLKTCSKFTGEHPCRSVISIKLQSNFIEIALRHGCSPVNFLHIFRTPFPKNTSGGLLLEVRLGKYGSGKDTLHLSNCFIIETLGLHYYCFSRVRSSRPDAFLRRKGILKIRSKFIGEHPCRSVISINVLCNFIEITLRQGCSPVNLLDIFRTPFPKNISGWLLLQSQTVYTCLEISGERCSKLTHSRPER